MFILQTIYTSILYSAKEILNARKDTAKNKDLAYLKELGGPFTTKDEVQEYMKSKQANKEAKNARLYIEVRYARSTSLSLKETAAVFRLKRGGKKLETEEYATNLMQYLDDSKNIASLTMADLLSRTPGVTVTGNGRNLKVLIRGRNTLQASTDPLFVVDGQIMGEGFSTVDFLDPTMIDRISVLKDGASASAYGTRGANGVILIELK